MGFNYEQYELAASRDNVDYNSWSNATGYTKEELISKIRTDKETVTYITGLLNLAQANYDTANARKCSGDKPWHSECANKERDKANRLNDINVYTAQIKTAQANIPVWQNELDDLIEKEANTPAPNSGGGTPSSAGTSTTGGANTGTTTGGTTTGATTVATTGTTTKSKTKNYLIIGGAVLVLGVVGFFVFRRN